MAVLKTIDLKDAAKELGVNLGKSQQKEVIKLTYDAFLKSVQEFTRVSPVDTGLYASSWSVQKQESEKQVSFGNTAPHAYHIEVGSSPFTPPIQPLIEWASRKLGQPQSSPEVLGLAYGVQKKIQKHGQKPLHILENGINDILIPAIGKGLDTL